MRKIGFAAACSILVLPALVAAQNEPMPPPAQPMQPGPTDQGQGTNPMPPPAEAQSPWVTDQTATPPTDQAAPSDDSTQAEAEEETPAPTEPVRRGLGLQGSLGLSDCTGEDCSDGDGELYEGTAMGIGGELVGVFRPIPLVGLGAGMHYNILGVDDVRGIDNSADYFNIEAQVRLYPIQNGPVDISFGPSFGYTFSGIKSEGDGGDFTQSLKGWTVGGHVGGEFFFAPLMTAGLSVRLWKPFWSEACWDYDVEGYGSDDGCDDVDDVEGLDEDDIPQLIWYVGGSFTYHIQM